MNMNFKLVAFLFCTEFCLSGVVHAENAITPNSTATIPVSADQASSLKVVTVKCGHSGKDGQPGKDGYNGHGGKGGKGGAAGKGGTAIPCSN